MKEEVKVLEEFIEDYYLNREIVCVKDIQAIENLIARNKELEEKVNKYEKQIDLEWVEDNYIEKSKVREKIEEYNKMINATYEDITCYGDFRRDGCIEIKNVLQELLEERN